MLSPNNITPKRNGRVSSNWSIDSGYGSGLHEDIKYSTTVSVDHEHDSLRSCTERSQLDARDIPISGPAPQQCQQTFGLGIEGVSKLQCDDGVYIKEEAFTYRSTTPCLSLRTDISNPSSPEPISPASPSEVRRSHARKNASKLPSQAIGRLTAWLDANRHHPYPSAETKQALAEACCITIKQVTTWFTNTRQRQLKSQDNDGRLSNDHIQAALSSRKGKKKDYGRVSPVDGLLSPPRLSPCPSISEQSSGEGDNWQCTFCRVSLTSKSWRRHEETQHHPKYQWTCLACGPRIQLQSSSSTICAFCELPNPDDDHFRYFHRVGDCMCKAEHERTFGRPDHLQQHARNFHKCDKPLSELVRDAWRKDGPGLIDDKSWTCGFCQEVLPNWDARATHIAGHFKAGMLMAQWRDNRVSQSTLPRESTMSEEPALLDALAGMGATFAGSSNYGSIANHARVDSAQHQQSLSTSMTAFMPMSASIPDITFDPFCTWGNPIDTFIPPTAQPFSTYTTQSSCPTVTTNNDPTMMGGSDVQYDINGNPVFDHGVWNSW